MIQRLAKLYDNYGVLKEMEDDLDSAMYFYNRALYNENFTKRLARYTPTVLIKLPAFIQCAETTGKH
ncbi:MAG: hypothetical protein U5K00_22730 [Melioribacteraceae bacterium]|nr:hypothetical protein [Melioribacteraceae bacterium]